MREVNFARDVIYGMAHILQIDPEEDLMKDHARAWASAVNSHVRKGWGFWTWPEFEVTEERAFRQVFYNDAAYAPGQGELSEVYYPATKLYYRMTANAPAGTLPTDATKWTPFTAEELAERHLAYEQYGKQDIDRFVSIDNTNPRTDGSALPWDFAPSGLGIDVGWYAGPTVWVTYIPRPPEFTTNTYDSTKAYERGDLVLDLEKGDCYRALAAGTGQGLHLPAYWLRQQFPYVLAEYVKYAAAGEQGAQLQEDPENHLKREVDKLIGQGQVTRYGKRPRTYHLQGVAALPA